ncbi:MAG: hypothetical protein AB7O73_09740 [Bacteroidia bacterium]
MALIETSSINAAMSSKIAKKPEVIPSLNLIYFADKIKITKNLALLFVCLNLKATQVFAKCTVAIQAKSRIQLVIEVEILCLSLAKIGTESPTRRGTEKKA